MVKINNNLNNLKKNNTFKFLSKSIQEYKKQNPTKKILSLGIGDVSFPIIKPVLDEMIKAVNDLGNINTFKGYGAYFGYDFLKNKIIEEEYSKYNITNDELYISIGAKSDTTNILELFDSDSTVCLISPIYPVYEEAIKLSGMKIEYLNALEKDDFLIDIPNQRYDIIYLCSPNNPLGIAYKKEYLEKWIQYAITNNSIILFDNVYEPFIVENDVCHSIYEIKDAKKVAIEFRSFSKKASFTGVRCSYYVVPNDLILCTNVNELWKNCVINKFNGADYIAQRGAWATYKEESKKAIKNNIYQYLENAKYLKKELETLGYKVYGGVNSPYLWVKIKENIPSWSYFEKILKELNIIVTPGIIFGCDNYIRLSALAKKEDIIKIVERIKKYDKKK